MASLRATGVYYLECIMDNPTGFKLHPDHSFEFFFSYGTLNRLGGGQWKQEKNTIIFASAKNRPADYTLLQSKKQNAAGIIISIGCAGKQFPKKIRAVINPGDNEEVAYANEEGIISANAAKAETIILLFESCPEKKFVFLVPDTTHNYFQFRFEAAAMHVVFEDFRLQLNADGLSGSHPLDKKNSFQYKRSGCSICRNSIAIDEAVLVE